MHQQTDKSSQSQLSQIEPLSIENLALFVHYYQVSKLQNSVGLTIYDKNTNEYEAPNYYRHKKRKRVLSSIELPIVDELVSKILDDKVTKVTKLKGEVDMKKTVVSPQVKNASANEDLQSREDKSEMSQAGKSTKTKKGRPKMQLSRLKIKINVQDPTHLAEDQSLKVLNPKILPIQIIQKEVPPQVQVAPVKSNPIFWNQFKKENAEIKGNLQQFLISPNDQYSPTFSQASDLNLFSKAMSKSNLSSHSKKQKVEESKKINKEMPSNDKSNRNTTPKKEYLPQTADKVIQSRLIAQDYDKSKSKSKNKSQSKIIKESTILIKTNRIGSLMTKKEEQYYKKIVPSPEPLLQPVTHKPKIVEKKRQEIKKIMIKQEDRLPIEDYQPELDQNQSEDLLEDNSLDLDQFGMHQNNSSRSERVYNKAFNSGLQTPKKVACDQTNLSQQKQKPIEKPKDQTNVTHKSSNPSKQANNEEKIVNKPPVHIVELSDKDQSQKSIKTPRKKIFSNFKDTITVPSSYQKQQFNGEQYNQEQMRMILGAKGNKYKQAIVMQYIRIGRATKQQQ